MKLKAYLHLTGISVSEFAKMVELVSDRAMYRYVAGSRLPKPTIMEAIHRHTDGAVSANDFFDLSHHSLPSQETKVGS